MQFVPWALALIASVAVGAVTCALLACRRTAIPYLLALDLAASAVVGLAIWRTWAVTHRLDLSIASVAICLGAAFGGFALYAGLLANAPERRARTLDLVVGPAVDGTHVILLSDEEPEEYDPRAVTAALARYAESEIDLPPEIGRPLIYASERSRYRQSGGSRARETVRAVASALEVRLRREGATFEVSAAFCDGQPSLASEVSRIVEGGGRTIIVVALAVAWSRAFTEAIEDLPTASLEAAGVTVDRAGPLWPSSHLSIMLAQRAVSSLGVDRAAAGVILLSEGDSWEHANMQEAYREQLVFFIQRVRCELVEAGVAASRIRRASLWLGEPDVTEAARHLAAVGARRIVLVPASFVCETIAARVDLPYAAQRAQADTGTIVTSVAPWGNDPAVVEALRDAVLAASERARTESE